MMAQLEREDTPDILSVMYRQETTTYRRNIVLPSRLHAIIKPVWRRTMVEWMCALSDTGSVSPEAVGVAAYYLDASVAKGLVQSERDFKLVSIAALHLSSKLYDTMPLRLSDLIRVCRGLFTEEDVHRMVLPMQTTLDWHLHPPTSLCYIHQFLTLLPSKMSQNVVDKLQRSSQLLCGLATCRDSCSRFLQSTLAFASLLISIEYMGEQCFPIYRRQCFLMHMAVHARIKSDSKTLGGAIEALMVPLQEEAVSGKFHAILGQSSDKRMRRKWLGSGPLQRKRHQSMANADLSTVVTCRA